MRPGTAPRSRDSNSPRMPQGTAPSSRDSNSGSQDAHRGASSFVRRGLLGGGTPARGQQGYRSLLASRDAGSMARYSPSMPGATRGSRDSSHGPQDARRTAGNSFPTGPSARSTPGRSQHGCRALLTGGGAQNGARSSPFLPPNAAPFSRNLNPMSQDARLATGSLVQMGPLRELTSATSQLGCRAALDGGEAHSGEGHAPPLPPIATPGSRD